MNRIAACYLARECNGPAPFIRFMDSYHKFPAGADHDLVVILKGYQRNQSGGVRLPIRDFDGRFFVSDWGHDVRAYRQVAEKTDYESLLFLNSFSEIKCDNWLAKMERGIMVGNALVGSSASYESFYTNSAGKRFNFLRRIFFKPFPNPHIRTNGFMIRRDVMLKVWPKFAVSKRAAYLAESGRNNITRKVLGMRLNVVVAGADWKLYSKDEWHTSSTFRNEEDGIFDNCIFHDRQTCDYSVMSADEQRDRAKKAWGGVTPYGGRSWHPELER